MSATPAAGSAYLWQPDLVAMHGISDALISVAYLCIALTLGWLVHRAGTRLPFPWIFLAFGLFIVACGATHLLEVWTLWHPTYWLSGYVKVLAAAAAVATAVALPPLVPRVMDLLRTEHRRAEKDRERLLAEARTAWAAAEEASRAKEEFLAVLSHELRSPLNAMVGWLRLLRTAPHDDALRTRALDTLDRSVRLQRQVINDLLDVSRIVSGKLDLASEPVDLAASCRRCIEAVRPVAEAKGVGLALRLHDQPIPVLGDPERLAQVIDHLLANAVKFTPAHGRVEICLHQRGDAAEIVVRDTGEGIAPDVLPHVFDRFRQADSSHVRRHGGLGLGLSIVRHLIERHGGRVAAESRVGHGSTFRVTLPLADAASLRAVVGPPARGAPGSLEGLRILVVEDSEDSREALWLLLQQTRADVVMASTVPEAVALFERMPPAVVISDIGLPGESGYDLMRWIRDRDRAHGRRTPAIAMTGYASREDHERAMQAGFDAHLPKPVEPETLIAKLRLLVAAAPAARTAPPTA